MVMDKITKFDVFATIRKSLENLLSFQLLSSGLVNPCWICTKVIVSDITRFHLSAIARKLDLDKQPAFSELETQTVGFW
jgi:hypothetical protein